MKRPPFGCLTGSGLLAGIISLVFIATAGILGGGSMFNPGPLNAVAGVEPVGGVLSHAETGGRCSACHPAFWETEDMDDRCLDCHAKLLASNQSFHAVMMAESQKARCSSCHTDHNGSQAELTIFELSKFPHDSLGFSLAAHATMASGAAFACSDCHPGKISDFETTTCQDCHAELDFAFSRAHLAEYGAGCLGCHDGVDLFGEGFDHNRLAFPLEGRHAEVECSACHPGVFAAADFSALSGACAACHLEDDVHEGQFGEDCSACHTSTSWEDATFDHSLSEFPLTGAHEEVACEACHEEGQQGRVFAGTPQACSACHAEPEVHLGLFSERCEECHTTDAWMPARFEGEHRFPMDHGQNAPGECRLCHPDSLQTYTCYGCHEHTLAEVRAEHVEEGISNFEDCTRCHPTGREEEGEAGDDD